MKFVFVQMLGACDHEITSIFRTATKAFEVVAKCWLGASGRINSVNQCRPHNTRGPGQEMENLPFNHPRRTGNACYI